MKILMKPSDLKFISDSLNVAFNSEESYSAKLNKAKINLSLDISYRLAKRLTALLTLWKEMQEDAENESTPSIKECESLLQLINKSIESQKVYITDDMDEEKRTQLINFCESNLEKTFYSGKEKDIFREFLIQIKSSKLV